MCPALTEGAHGGYVVDGQTRSFEVRLPDASFTGPRPVFFAFHGTGETGASFLSRINVADYTSRGFIVIAPDAVGNGTFWPVWDAMRLPTAADTPNKDVELFDQLIGCAKSTLSVDTTRIFVGGHSAGGIMVNHMLRSRSTLLAGGIVASGVFDLTEPSGPPADLDGLLSIVTWGGDNDQYSGSAGGVAVPKLSFVEQASLASRYYAAQPNVDQVQCRGNDVGHMWLPLNGWFIDLMLAHPKGTVASHALQLAPLPAGAPAACSIQPYVVPPLPPIACASTPRAGCTESCQLLADCAVDNRTVGPALGGAVAGMGFGDGTCGNCVAACEQGATTDADATVLGCIANLADGQQCTGGIEGAFPLFFVMNQCCSTAPGSNLCANMCHALAGNAAASAFFPVCQGQ